MDLPNCVLEGDAGFTLHAILCLLLGHTNCIRPMRLILRLNSMANICKISFPVDQMFHEFLLKMGKITLASELVARPAVQQ